MGLLDLISIIPNAFKTIDNITNAISNEKIAALNATTDQERIRANERVSTLQARRDVLIAEAGVSKANLIIRSVMALPVALVIWKLLAWDKVMGSLVGCSMAAAGTCGMFTTDPLDDNQWRIIGVVTAFYFLYEGGIAVSRIIKR